MHYLKNESIRLNSDIILTGLDVDYDYYAKVRPRKLTEDAVLSFVGKSEENSYNILLAHSPAFFEGCAQAGYDLVLSGHYHGGAVRLPIIGGAISPQFRPFPKYSRGMFKKMGSRLIVSGGAGSHTINLRLFNKPEILVINIKPE